MFRYKKYYKYYKLKNSDIFLIKQKKQNSELKNLNNILNILKLKTLEQRQTKKLLHNKKNRNNKFNLLQKHSIFINLNLMNSLNNYFYSNKLKKKQNKIFQVNDKRFLNKKVKNFKIQGIKNIKLSLKKINKNYKIKKKNYFSFFSYK